MSKNKHTFAKRQREMEKKRKADEKRARKLNRKSPADDSAEGADGTGERPGDDADTAGPATDPHDP